MNKSLLLLLISLVWLNVHAQTIDEKIGNAMNYADWFALDSIYNSAPKDSIHPFLEIYSRCLLGNRFNRPDISIPAFQELFNTQSDYLDLGNLISSTFMFGMDMSRMGQNEAAASMTESVLDATRQYLDSVMISNLTSQANRYSALADYNPYQVKFNDENYGRVPFVFVPVGPKEKGSVLMHLQESSINGFSADITFDTGAGTNLITPEMMEKYNLIPLEKTRVAVKGMDWKEGYIAMAKELKIGDITVYDVPFTVISLSSNNDEADQYIDAFNIVLGSDLMLHLKDLTFDFKNHQIIIPTITPTKRIQPSNICFSPTMNLLTKGKILGESMLMCLDSGDAAFGSANGSFFDANKEYVELNGRQDSIRSAGIGGFMVEDCYYMSNIPIMIAGNVVNPYEFVVIPQGNNYEYDARIGLRTMMLFDKIRFNMVDFVLTTSQSGITKSMLTHQFSNHNIPPALKLQSKNGINTWQALGIIGIGVARSIINPNAPAYPDL